ncbi:YqkE family protein [Paenibacillus alkaliterrae]|uniref:YqkE family protein n=1 Tax=Paenibacillus alkaliterrae TaxID=320909 RepID=UPI001F28CDD9|nr:YqkE family protein [Paenibacillus alkaliterrae]MCF2937678.1 YqkE family protein [Paenibacillus alkaliterrae]
MGKKQKQARNNQAKPSSKAEEGMGLSLKDLLGAEVIGKLKAQADDMKQAEAARKEEARKQEEEKKKQERKLLENDFAYLLENSDPRWSKHK